MIEVPAFETLAKAKRVLLFGAGGGYDVLGAIPLFSTLGYLKDRRYASSGRNR